jgi:hypothetical protein
MANATMEVEVPAKPKGVPVSQLIRVTVECKGITPLLMNPMSDEQLLKLWMKEKAPKDAPRPEPHKACEILASQYTDKTGPYIPGHCLYACLVGAGRFVRLSGKTMISTRKDTQLPALMGLETERLYLKTPFKPGWDVDIKKGINPNGGEAVAIVRPRFDVWSFDVVIWIDTTTVAEKTIRDLFDKAGKTQGLLDFRPSRKGIYGQFVVNNWKMIDAS